MPRSPRNPESYAERAVGPPFGRIETSRRNGLTSTLEQSTLQVVHTKPSCKHTNDPLVFGMLCVRSSWVVADLLDSHFTSTLGVTATTWGSPTIYNSTPSCRGDYFARTAMNRIRYERRPIPPENIYGTRQCCFHQEAWLGHLNKRKGKLSFPSRHVKEHHLSLLHSLSGRNLKGPLSSTGVKR